MRDLRVARWLGLAESGSARYKWVSRIGLAVAAVVGWLIWGLWGALIGIVLVGIAVALLTWGNE